MSGPGRVLVIWINGVCKTFSMGLCFLRAGLGVTLIDNLT